MTTNNITEIEEFVKKNYKSSCIRFCSKLDAQRFLNYVYKNREVDKIGLDRKYEHFKNFDFTYKTTIRNRKNPKYFLEKLYVSSNLV